MSRKLKTRVDGLRDAIFAATDGMDTCDAINELGKHAEKGDAQAKEVLARYVTDGPINQFRVHACSSLARSVKVPDARFAALFRHGLADPQLKYWSILGYLNSAGKAAYPALIQIAEDKNTRLAERAKAVKCLAMFSKQQFDRALPADPGYWKEADLRLSELRTWAKSGYQDGEGYLPLRRHVALDNPITAFERVVSRFDKVLAKKREAQQDLSEPTDWLTIAEPNDIQGITARWNLPSMYLEFLIRFSPVRVILNSEEFYNPFQLFGAGELIEAQEGYSYNPIERRPIEDWPTNLIVIASHGGDPFVLDLSKSDGEEAPVDTAEHGIGVWEFRRVADSFSEFLEQLAMSCW